MDDEPVEHLSPFICPLVIREIGPACERWDRSLLFKRTSMSLLETGTGIGKASPGIRISLGREPSKYPRPEVKDRAVPRFVADLKTDTTKEYP